MSQQKYDVRVKLKNGEEVLLKNATGYRIEYNRGYAAVEKNGYNLFFNLEEIVYIGRDFD